MAKRNKKQQPPSNTAYWRDRCFYFESRYQTLRETKRTEGWVAIIRDLIKWPSLVVISIMGIVGLPDILKEISGEETILKILINWGAESPVNLILVIALIFVSISSYNRKKTIEKLISKYGNIMSDEDKKKYPQRSSSEILPDGKTRPEDI